MGQNLQQENNELKVRLRTIGAILRLGRDTFTQPDLVSAGIHVVNDSKMLLLYDRSILLSTYGGKQEVVAEYALPTANVNTEYAVSARKFVKALLPLLPPDGSAVEILPGSPLYKQLSEKVQDSVNCLFGDMKGIVAVPLRSAARKESEKEPFIWLLEYKEEVPKHVSGTIPLLASDFGNALWSHVAKGVAGKVLRSCRKVTLGRLLLVLLILFVISLFTIRVEHTVSAEFEIRPQSMQASYALFDCLVKECFKEDGETVRKGEKILAYDTERMKYLLASSVAQLKEAEAQYETESKAAFTEREKLGRLRVLKYKSDQARVTIAEAKWYLSHSIVTAPADGILALADGSADKLAGRALRLGEKQFEVLTANDMIAEIMVNERDASVLDKTPKIVLFLHTRPEYPIQAEVVSSKFYPELTEAGIYTYKIKAKMLADESLMRYGMRGIARVTGEKVKLGYYLFRGLVLWWRGV